MLTPLATVMALLALAAPALAVRAENDSDFSTLTPNGQFNFGTNLLYSGETFTFTNETGSTVTSGRVSLVNASSDYSIGGSTSPGECDDAATYPLAPDATCTVQVDYYNADESAVVTGTLEYAYYTGDTVSGVPVPRGTLTVPFVAEEPQPSLLPEAASLDFGAQRHASYAQTTNDLLTNTSGVAIKISSDTLHGANAGDFSIAEDYCANSTLEPGDSCWIGVGFNPTAALGTVENAYIEVDSDAPNQPHEILPLSGDSAGPAITPENYEYGQRVLGSRTEHTFTVTNPLPIDVTADPPSVTNAHFHVESGTTCDNTVLAEGQSCSVVVGYEPTVDGETNEGKLDVGINNETTIETGIEGSGGVPALTSTPSAFDYGTQVIGHETTHTFTIKNTGDMDAELETPEMVGGNRSNFAIDASASTCADKTLAPNETCVVVLGFTPNAAMTRTSTLSIPSDSPATPLNVAVEGVGREAGPTAPPTLIEPLNEAELEGNFDVRYELPESPLSGSITLTFADAGATDSITLDDVPAGEHSVTIDPENLIASTGVFSIGGPNVLSPGEYTLTLSYQDAFGDSPAMTTRHITIVNPHLCHAGHYSASGEEPCEQATPGHFAEGRGATAQVDCPPGTYNAASGSTTRLACLPADIGHYVDEPGQAAERECVAGTYQDRTGEIGCEPAEPGHFVATNGAFAQLPCAAGSYAADMASVACTSAPAGYYVDEQGATAAKPCPAGTEAPEGASSCAATPTKPVTQPSKTAELDETQPEASASAGPAPSPVPAIAGASLNHRCVASSALELGLHQREKLVVSYRINVPATVSYTVSRRDGSPEWHHCPLSKGHQPGSYQAVWTGSHDVSAGPTKVSAAVTAGYYSPGHGRDAHAIALSAALAAAAVHASQLRPGTYTLTILATNGQGKRSTPTTIKFWVVRQPRHR